MTATLSVWIDRLREAALAHGRASEARKSRLANKHYAELSEAIDALRSAGEAGRESLVGLLEDEEPWVRLWVARYCLVFAETEATRVLRELAAGTRMTAFNAEMVLREWAAGRLLP